MMNLSELIDVLRYKNNLSINLHDATGVLSVPPLMLPQNKKMHSKPFCYAAKTTGRGYFLCTHCKGLCCEKAQNTKSYFFGTCPYGLFELVYPIVSDGKVLCILFIGNMTENMKKTKKKAKNACRAAGVSYVDLKKFLKEIEPAERVRILSLARLIESFILLQASALPPIQKSPDTLHWAILNMKEYADAHFKQQITLKSLSKLFFLNEKYAGRLFLKEVGISFHQYVNEKRFNCAARLLKTSDKTVLSIALDSGFNSISYFNRAFNEYYHQTPGEYRKNAPTA